MGVNLIGTSFYKTDTFLKTYTLSTDPKRELTGWGRDKTICRASGVVK